jgi:hypothetical protein
MRKKTPDDREARVEEHRRRFHEVAQRAVDEHNARGPDEPRWPDRVLPPGRDATRDERAAWDAQVQWDIDRLRRLAEKAQAALDGKRQESDAA